MSGKGFLRILVAGVFASILTWAAFQWDLARTLAFNSDYYLRWARQISTQVESMTLTAQERGELDPLNWSVSFLTQGVEPRMMKVFLTPPDESANLGDTYHLDTVKGVFEYSKMILPEDKRGVKIVITTGHSGFLGSRTPLGNDLRLGALWLLVFSVTALITRRRSDNPDDSPLPVPVEPVLAPEPQIIYRDVPVPAPDELRPVLLKWVGDAKELLTQLGRAVRDVLRDAQLLASASTKSGTAVESLHRRLHAELRDMHAGRKALEDSQKIITLAQAIAGHAATEAGRLGPNGQPVARFVSQLERLLGEMEKMNRLGEKAVKKLEVSMEPLVTDVDIAFAAQAEVKRTLIGISEHIDQTKFRLLGQAKLIQNLNQEIQKKKSAS